MRYDQWERIIKISLGSGRPCRLESTRDAARILLNDWPRTSGTAYRSAVIDCARAIRGDVAHDAIPMKLANAAYEAGLDWQFVYNDRAAQFESEIAQVCVEIMHEDMHVV